MNMNILSIDRGRKYIGLARTDKTNFVFPIGYIDNNSESIFQINNIVGLYHITQIVIGKPKDPKISIQIAKFAKQIYISTEIQPEFIDENFTTTTAKNITGIYTKSTINDVVAAMEILKRKLLL